MEGGSRSVYRGRGSSRGFRGRGGAAGGPRTPRPEEPRHAHTESQQRVSAQGKEEQEDDNMDVEATTESRARFADLEQRGIDKRVIQAITQDLKYEFMTPVQDITVNEVMTGKDCLAQAKTGTGKTIAFLLPAIMNIIKRGPDSGISTLIISPTRELAMQITNEAQILIKHLNFKAVSVIGGTNMDTEVGKIKKGCQILVATPGRLLDHMNNEDFMAKLGHVNTYILDEADRLLDQGFLPAIEKITARLPDRTKHNRQSLLFSATVPEGVTKIATTILSKDYKHFTTISPDDVDTHKKVDQHAIIVPFETQNAMLSALLAREFMDATPEDPFKVVVFYNTARGAEFSFEAFSELKKSRQTPFESMNLMQIHSRMSQSARVKTSALFKDAKTGVLFSSDVSARGMDYPGVTHVFQVGKAADKETYIHRIGRTGRAGRSGEGFVLLDPTEERFLKSLVGFPFRDYAPEKEIRENFASYVEKFNRAVQMVNPDKRAQAFTAWLGSQKGQNGQSLLEVVERSFKYSKEALGFDKPPGVTAKFIGNAGFKSLKHMFEIVAPSDKNNNNRNNNKRPSNNHENGQDQPKRERSDDPSNFRSRGGYANGGPTRGGPGSSRGGPGSSRGGPARGSPARGRGGPSRGGY